MIGVGMKIQVKKSKVISDAGRVLALPLVEMTQLLADRIFARLARGQGPDGPWNTYGGAARDDHRFWVAPGREQPTGEGFLARVEQGQWAGWAVYETIAAYYRLTGELGKPHDFDETGRLKQQAAVRIITPRRIRLAFYGSHRELSAKVIARLATRHERVSILTPSSAEVEQAQRLAAKTLNERVINAMRNVESAQALTSRANAINRRASKLLGD